MQVKFSSWVKLVTYGEVKRSNINKFRLPCQILKFLYQTLCALLQIIDKNILICCLGHAPGVGLGGAGWVKNLSVGICDGAPSTARSSCLLLLPLFMGLCVWSLFCCAVLSVLSGFSINLTLKAPIATTVVCLSRLLKYLRSLYGKQCGPRSDCSYRSSLFWVHAVCFYTGFVSNARQLFAADDFCRRHFQMHFFLGALSVNGLIELGALF